MKNHSHLQFKVPRGTERDPKEKMRRCSGLGMTALVKIALVWFAVVGVYARACDYPGDCHVYAKRAFFLAVNGDHSYAVCRCVDVATEVHRPSPGSGNWPILLAVTAVLNGIDTIGGEPFSDVDLYNFLRGVGGWRQHNGKEGASYVYEAWNVAAVLALLDWAQRNNRTQTVNMCNTWLRTQWAKHALAAVDYPDKFITISGDQSFGPRNPNRRPVDRDIWSTLSGNRMLTRSVPNAAHSGSPDSTTLGSLLAWAIDLPSRSYRRSLPQLDPSRPWDPDPTEDWAWVLSVVSILNNGAQYDHFVPAAKWGLTNQERTHLREFVQAQEAQTQAMANRIAGYLAPFRPGDKKGILYRRYAGGRMLTVLQESSNRAKPAVNVVYYYPSGNHRVAKIVSPSDWAGVQVPESTAIVDNDQNRVTAVGGRKHFPNHINTHEVDLPQEAPLWEILWNFNGFGTSGAPFSALDLTREIQPEQKLVLKVNRDLAANPGGLNLNLDPANPIVFGPTDCNQCTLEVIGTNKKRLRFKPNGFQGTTTFGYRITDGSVRDDGLVTVITGMDTGDSDPGVFQAVDNVYEMSPFAPELVMDVLADDVLTGDVAFTGNGLIYDETEIQGTLEIVDLEGCSPCVRYRPNAGFVGSVHFDYEIINLYLMDDRLLLDQAGVSIHRLNNPPTAVADTFELAGHTGTKRLNLTRNDDPGDAGDRATLPLAVEDWLVSEPLGTVTRFSNRKVDYTPPNPLPPSGIDQFEYRVKDRLDARDTAVVTIDFGSPGLPGGTPVCDSDIFTEDEFINTGDTLPVTIDVLANDSQVHGSPLFLGEVNHSGAGSLEILDGQVLVYTPRVGTAESGAGACFIDYQILSEDGGEAFATAMVEVFLGGLSDGVTIARHPASIVGAPEGVDVSLTVDAFSADGSPLAYQWERRPIGSSGPWSALSEAGHFSGTDADVLDILNVRQQERDFAYRVRVNIAGSATSAVSNAANLVAIPFKVGDTYDGTATPQTPVAGEVIEAEHFNEGQFGYAFFDGTAHNSGNDDFRGNAVDVSSEGAGDLRRTYVTDVAPDEWLTYNLRVDLPGSYQMTMAYRTDAGAGLGSTFLLTSENDSVDLGLGLLNSAGHWTTDTLGGILEFQTAGDKTLVLGFNDPYLDIDHFRLVPQSNDQGPAQGNRHGEGLWVQAEDYDVGPHNVAYHDKTLFNSGNLLYRQGYADTSAEDSLVYLTAMDNGEWLEYSFAFAGPGPHDLHLNYRAGNPVTLRLQDNTGLDLPLTLPATGTAWQTLTVPDFLALDIAGDRVLRWFVESGGLELDAFALGHPDPLNAFDRQQYSTGIPGDPCQNTPRIPGILHLECYDQAVDPHSGQILNGQNRVYFDTTPEPNQDSFWYRGSEGPDLRFENPAGHFSGHVLTHVQPGEWLTYSVDVVPPPGTSDYAMFVVYTSKYTIDPPSLDGQFSVELWNQDRVQWDLLVDETLPAVTPNTWDRIIAIPGLVIPPGRQILRVNTHTATFKLDRLEIFPSAPLPEPLPDILVVQGDDFGADQSHFFLPQSDLLNNDLPRGELAIAEVANHANGYAWVNDDLHIEFSTTGAFWWQRQGSFTYYANHRDNPYVTVPAKVVVVPEGPLVKKDYFIAPNDDNAATLDLIIPIADLLDNDLPAGGFCDGDLVCLEFTGVSNSVQGSAAWSAADNTVRWRYDAAVRGGSFEYTIRIPGTAFTHTGKVFVTTDNPIKALDDVVVKSGLQNHPLTVITREDVLANDLVDFGVGDPEPGLSWLYFDPAFVPGPERFEPLGSAQYHPWPTTHNPLTAVVLDILNFDQKYVKFPYRTQICQGQGDELCPHEPDFYDEAEVTLVRGPHLQHDVVVVPFQPEAGEVVIAAETLVANDWVGLDQGLDEIYVVGAGGGNNGSIGDTGGGDVLRYLDEIIYQPAPAFWEARRDEFTYQVWLNERPESIAEARVILIATDGVLANDDTVLVSTTNPLWITRDQLLGNDRPNPGPQTNALLRIGPAQGGSLTTAAGGSLAWTEDSVRYIPPNPPVFDHFPYRVSLADDPNYAAEGRVWIVPHGDAAGMPHPEAQPDQAALIAGSNLWIDVLANDQQAHLSKSLPTTGAVIDQPRFGTVVLENQGFRYTPSPGQTGHDRFTYRAQDQYGRLTAQTEVSLTVHPEPLVANADTYVVQPGMAPLPIQLADLTANDLPAGGFTLAEVGTPLYGELRPVEGQLLYHPDERFWLAGGDRFTYRIAATVNGQELSAEGVVTIHALSSQALFGDDFESGSLTAWDHLIANHPDGGVDALATDPLAGNWSLEVAIPPNADQHAFYAEKLLNSAETHLALAMRMDASDMVLEEGTAGLAALVLRGHKASLTLGLRHMAGSYQLRIQVRDDSGHLHTSAWRDVPNHPFTLQLTWWSADDPTTHNGGARLWVDGRPLAELDGLDSESSYVDRIRLGALYGMRASDAGRIRYDDVGLWRGHRARILLHQDGFESGNLSAWPAQFTQGGELRVDESAAATGNFGLLTITNSDQVDDRRMYLEDHSPAEENHLLVAWDFTPLRAIPGHTGVRQNYPIFTAGGPAGAAFMLDLQFADGSYGLTLLAQRDNGTWATSRTVPLSLDWHEIHLAWQAATPGREDGSAGLILNGNLAAELSGLANASKTVSKTRLGVIYGLGADRVGHHFDNYRLWRGGHSRQSLLDEGFEQGLVAWSPYLQGGATAAAKAAAAMEGQRGLRIGLPAGATAPEARAQVREFTCEGAGNLGMSFQLDHGGLSMPHQSSLSIATLVAGVHGGVADLLLGTDSRGRTTLQLRARTETGWRNGAAIPITDNPHTIALYWEAGNPALAEGGRAELWIDGVPATIWTDFANGGYTLTMNRIGANYGAGSGISGHLDFDNYQTWTNR